MGRPGSIFVLSCAALAFSLSACSHGSSVTIGNRGPGVVHGSGGHGPPPHAPAHGHREKHHGPSGDVELTFDSGLGVYVVVDLPNHYYWDGTYLRIEDGRWYASAELGGDWSPRSESALPPGLRKKQAGHGPPGSHPGQGHGRGRGHAPAKGGW
jgi:hypothetical protein